MTEGVLGLLLGSELDLEVQLRWALRLIIYGRDP